MASLIEQLRQQGNPSLPQAPLAGQLRGQTESLANLARAQQMGSGGLGRQSRALQDTTAEELALGEVEGQEQQLQQERQTQAARVSQAEQQQEQQFQFQAQDLEERTLNQRMELSNQASQVLSQFARETTRMELAETKAAMEFSASLTRLSMDDYMERLQLEGRRNRLDDEASFREAIAEAVFQDERELLIGDLNFRSILGADKRASTEWLASFDLEAAIRMAESNAAAAAAIGRYQSTAQGVSAVAQGSSDLYNTFGRSSSGGQAKPPADGNMG